MKYKVYNTLLCRYEPEFFINQNGNFFRFADGCPEYGEVSFEDLCHWDDEIEERFSEQRKFFETNPAQYLIVEITN